MGWRIQSGGTWQNKDLTSAFSTLSWESISQPRVQRGALGGPQLPEISSAFGELCDRLSAFHAGTLLFCPICYKRLPVCSGSLEKNRMWITEWPGKVVIWLREILQRKRNTGWPVNRAVTGNASPRGGCCYFLSVRPHSERKKRCKSGKLFHSPSRLLSYSENTVLFYYFRPQHLALSENICQTHSTMRYIASHSFHRKLDLAGRSFLINMLFMFLFLYLYLFLRKCNRVKPDIPICRGNQ